MLLKRLAPLLAAGLLAVAAACDDRNPFEASLPTSADRPHEVYALTGTSPELPSAFFAVAQVVMRVDSLTFDVAFDITPAGTVAIYPVRALGQPLSARSVGIRVDSTRSYGAVTRAPGGSYLRDSVVVVPTGRPVILETPFSGCGLYSISQFVYTKLVVDSVDTDRRKIYFHAVNNPNCGFRELRPGVTPED
jgi:hypothetical protein